MCINLRETKPAEPSEDNRRIIFISENSVLTPSLCPSLRPLASLQGYKVHGGGGSGPAGRGGQPTAAEVTRSAAEGEGGGFLSGGARRAPSREPEPDLPKPSRTVRARRSS